MKKRAFGAIIISAGAILLFYFYRKATKRNLSYFPAKIAKSIRNKFGDELLFYSKKLPNGERVLSLNTNFQIYNEPDSHSSKSFFDILDKYLEFIKHENDDEKDFQKLFLQFSAKKCPFFRQKNRH
ncbi:hypothetical protein MHBO_002647 [Bonamia ostreae]|uniref:Uncharacterized protein n=1 Tax=Bonamia ostreae TaxID=126728 RepID=A0ABV2AN07_9EUKA